MRVWSLKTCCSMARQSRSLHSYTDVAAVLMTCGLRLAPLSSRPPDPRQPIPGITLGGASWVILLPPVRAAGACSPRDPRGEHRGVASFLPTGLRRRRTALSTEAVGSDVGQVHVCRPRPVPFWASPPSLACSLVTMAQTCVRRLSLAARLQPGPGGSGPVLGCTPLHGLRASRYRGGEAVHWSLQWPGIAPGIGRQVV
jgi:hypothetical protein